MQVRLEVAHSKANVKRVVLRHDAVIGRSAECSLRIASSLVSRQHCQILLRDGAVYLRDLRSSNGTFLNGNPLRPYEDVVVPPGSELSVGGVRFYVRYDAQKAIPGPGSTVDYPRVQGVPEEDSSATAEWELKDVLPGTAAADTAPAPGGRDVSGEAIPASSEMPTAEVPIAVEPPAEESIAADEAAGWGDASNVEPLASALPVPEPSVADAPAEAGSAANEEETAPLEPADSPVSEAVFGPDDAAPDETEPEAPTRRHVAMPLAAPEDAMAAPGFVPAEIPAAAPEEEMIAAKGDEIDTRTVEAEGPSEQETIDAGQFRFDEMPAFEGPGDFAQESPAEDALALTPSEDSGAVSQSKTTGLRSLFSLFGRKKVPQSAPESESSDDAPQFAAGAAESDEDTVTEDATADIPASAEAAPQQPPASHASLPASDEEPVELLEAAEVSAAENLAATDEPEAAGTASDDPRKPDSAVDPGFSDFLKQIGQ